MTETTTDNVKPVPIPKVNTEEKPVDRKTYLLDKRTKSKGKLPKGEAEELEAILEAERVEHERGALIHKLCERVDTHGRKEASKVKREITDRVAKFGAARATEVKALSDAHGQVLKKLDREMKAAMQAIQEDYNKRRAVLIEEHEKQQEALSARYAAQFDEAQMEMESRIEEVDNIVIDFQGRIRDLTELSHLRALEKGDTLKITGKNGEVEYLVVPGQPPPQ